jgi:hypothetical protein
MTSAPVSAAIQPMHTEVSSPPEYASTTRSVTEFSLSMVVQRSMVLRV